jgi:hypothetical protein
VVVAFDADRLALGYLPQERFHPDGVDAALAQLVAAYDPRREAIVLIPHEENHFFRVQHPLTPPEAYELLHDVILCHAA